MESTVNAQADDADNAANNPKRSRSPWLVRLAVLTIIGGGVMFMFGRMRPTNLGVTDGRFAPCPASPNCVSTQAERESQRIALVRYNPDNFAAVRAAIKKAIEAMPRTKIVTEQPDYFHVECTSLICRYVDDLEIWLEAGEIHVRSASRVGYSDMGINRKRVESLFKALAEANVTESIPAEG